MAPFNPQYQPVGPGNYLGLSQSIQQPEPDLTVSSAIKGVTDVLNVGVKAADEVVKKGISDQIEAATDKERSGFTQALSNTKDMVMQGLGKALGIQGSSDPVPGALEDGLDRVDSLEGARGKISTTQYWGRLTNITKDLRAQFPGYREYIDETVSKVTGHNPANAYMSSLIQDLNRASSGQGKEDPLLAKTRNLMFTPEVMGMPNSQTKFKQLNEANGDPNVTQDVYTWASGWAQTKQGIANRQAQLTLGKADREAKASAATADATVYGNKLISDSLDNTLLTVQGKDKPIKIADYVVELQRSGKGSQEVAQTLAGLLTANKAQTMASFDQQMNTQLEGSNETLMSRSGKGIEDVKKQLSEGYDRYIDLIVSQQYGMANSSSKHAKNKEDDAVKALLQDESTSAFTLNQMLGRRLLGDTNNELFTKQFYGSTDTDKYGSFVHSQALKMLVQPQINEGQIKTFNDVLDKARTGGNIGAPTKPDGTVKSPAERKADAKATGDIIKQVNLITTPGVDDEGKKNIARAAYSPGPQRDMLNKFALENRDPNTGQVLPGKHTVYDMFFSQAHTKEMFRLGQSEPQIWKDYVDSSTHAWGRIMFPEEIKEMNNIASSPEAKLGWNTDTNKWVVNFRYDSKVPFHLTETEKRHINDRLSAVNNSMTNLRAVGEVSGFDTNAFLLKNFLDAGVTLQKLPVNMTSELMKAMIMGNTPSQEGSQSPRDGSGSRKTEAPVSTPRPDENNAPATLLGGKIRGYQDEQGNSLQAFLTDPSLGKEPPKTPIRKTFKDENLGHILAIDYGPIQHFDKHGNVIRTEPGEGTVIPRE